MTDWLDTLGPEERASWDSFVTHTRAEAAQKIDSSAFVLQLVPDAKDVDIKFAVELGLAIMLDKPIVAIAMPGIPVPPGLRRVVHHVIEMDEDLDTDAGRQEMSDKLKPIADRILGRGGTGA